MNPLYQKRRVKVNDLYMTYQDTRAGEETIVFIHDSHASSGQWSRVVPRLRGVARCIVPDLPGCGESRSNGDTYDIRQQFDYFVRWIEDVNLPKRYIIVGTGCGFIMAARFASLHPGKVKSIGLTLDIPKYGSDTNECFVCFYELRSSLGDGEDADSVAKVTKICNGKVETTKITSLSSSNLSGENRLDELAHQCLTVSAPLLGDNKIFLGNNTEADAGISGENSDLFNSFALNRMDAPQELLQQQLGDDIFQFLSWPQKYYIHHKYAQSNEK